MDNIRGADQVYVPNLKQEVKPQENAGNQTPETVGDKVVLTGDKPSPAIKPHKKWLFLNYIAADCNLKEFQMKNIDNQELVGSDNNTHVVAYIDVGPQPNPMEKTWSNSRSYYVNKDDTPNKLNSELIAEYGRIDTSSPDTLKKFIVDAIGKYPSDYVCLVLNDHGGGFTGAMSDESDGNFMSTPQLKQAIDEAQKVTGKKIDILGFDACLMAEAEVAYELKDNANIMLASEESEGGPGWTYNTMLGGENIGKAIKTVQEAMLHKINVGPEEFAKIVVEVNKQHGEDIPTFSAINMGKMDQFKDQLNGLAKAIKGITDPKDKQDLRNAIKSAESYGGGWSPYGDIHDVKHMAQKLTEITKDEKVKKAAEEVIKGVGEVVIANESSPTAHPNSAGISVYAPTNQTKLGYDYSELAFAKDTEWDEMLQELGIGAGNDQDNQLRTPRFWPDGTPRKPK